MPSVNWPFQVSLGEDGTYRVVPLGVPNCEGIGESLDAARQAGRRSLEFALSHGYATLPEHSPASAAASLKRRSLTQISIAVPASAAGVATSPTRTAPKQARNRATLSLSARLAQQLQGIANRLRPRMANAFDFELAARRTRSETPVSALPERRFKDPRWHCPRTSANNFPPPS